MLPFSNVDDETFQSISHTFYMFFFLCLIELNLNGACYKLLPRDCQAH